MNKQILLGILVTLLIFKTTVYAQEFEFGIVGGFDVANSRAPNTPIDRDSRVFYPMISFNANGYMGYKSPGFWGISAEPGFIQKGGVMKNDKDNKDDDIKFQFNYIQLPLLADFFLGDEISLSIGPEFAYLINAKTKSKNSSSDNSNLRAKDFELSGIVGINYDMDDNFDIGLRYSHGLTYVSEILWADEIGNPLSISKVTNQYFQVYVRFKI